MQKLEEPTLCIIEPEPFRFSASGRNQLLLLLKHRQSVIQQDDRWSAGIA